MARLRRLSRSALRDRRADRRSSAVLIVAMLGLALVVVAPWGRYSWFALEVPRGQIAGWLSYSWLPVWVMGGLTLWGAVAWCLASGYREGDRRRWVWGREGLILAVVISLVSAYAASRNGMALFEDRILWRQTLLSPIETTVDAEVGSLDVRCTMKSRRRSLRGDRIDVPYWSLGLKDGRVLDVGGVRGAGIGRLSQQSWLRGMRRLSRYPVRPGVVEPACVTAVLARFAPADRPFVRSLFAVPPPPAGEIYLCPPDYRPSSAPSGSGCLRTPLQPGAPRVEIVKGL